MKLKELRYVIDINISYLYLFSEYKTILLDNWAFDVYGEREVQKIRVNNIYANDCFSYTDNMLIVEVL